MTKAEAKQYYNQMAGNCCKQCGSIEVIARFGTTTCANCGYQRCRRTP